MKKNKSNDVSLCVRHYNYCAVPGIYMID